MVVYGECDCFVMQMLYVCVLCASCGSSQCCVLHDLQFVNAGRGCNRRPYRRGILQSRSHNCVALSSCMHTFLVRSYIWSIYTTDSYYYLMNFAILMKYMIMKLLVYFFGCLGGYLTEIFWTYYVHFFMYGRKFIEAYRC